MRLTRGARAALAVLFAGAAVGACGGSMSTTHKDALLGQHAASKVTVRIGHAAGLGRILVDGAGHALYMFPPDAGSRVSCVGPCAGTWPPLAITDGTKPQAGPGVNAADLSTLSDPNTGARIVTYLGYPLYRYACDLRAGVANGQDLFNNGGPWYVLTPAGEPNTTDPAGNG